MIFEKLLTIDLRLPMKIDDSISKVHRRLVLSNKRFFTSLIIQHFEIMRIVH
jgi:hypothetical protein